MSEQKINIPMLGTFLGIVAALAAGLLSGVQAMTAPQIEANKKAAISQAMDQVLPTYDNDPASETNTFICGRGWEVTFYTARKGGRLLGMQGKWITPMTVFPERFRSWWEFVRTDPLLKSMEGMPLTVL
ncbi:hypothetical protein EGM51_03665 [Verrucomicrobia bacterium S94]|nr:hypothetical protein EGM51_03665 [Verrucomicrobia bacterium S94]